jgi:hypothetical protein
MPSRCLSSIISRSNWATAPKRLDEGDAAEQATGGARAKNLAEKIEGLRKKRSQRVGVDDLLGGEDFFELGRRFASPSISVWGPNRRCGPPPRVAPELESSSQSPVMGGFAFAGVCEPMGPARREGSGGLCQDKPDEDRNNLTCAASR